jgi:hypothetical protein
VIFQIRNRRLRSAFTALFIVVMPGLVPGIQPTASADSDGKALE